MCLLPCEHGLTQSLQLVTHGMTSDIVHHSIPKFLQGFHVLLEDLA